MIAKLGSLLFNLLLNLGDLLSESLGGGNLMMLCIIQTSDLIFQSFNARFKRLMHRCVTINLCQLAINPFFKLLNLDMGKADQADG